MTAEVVLMNKQGVAMATDSAGTTGGKILNSNNKLFMLSKRHPVGVMVYGSAEIVGGPTDVAVITKGDGFIWINRKHYFDPKKNHHFFSNYHNEENAHE